jgi:hypothetical protein
MKALVLPEGVDLRPNITRARPQPAKGGDMLIADLAARQSFGKRIRVELRIGARPGHRSYIGDKSNFQPGQHIDEFANRMRRVADGKEWNTHASHMAAFCVYFHSKGGLDAAFKEAGKRLH